MLIRFAENIFFRKNRSCVTKFIKMADSGGKIFNNTENTKGGTAVDKLHTPRTLLNPIKPVYQ